MIKKEKIFLISIISIILILFSNIVLATEGNLTNTSGSKYHNPDPIKVPEININLKIKNLTKGCKTYVLLSENLLKYNMNKFIENNLENPYIVQAQEARTLKKFLDSEDYFGYVEYFNESGFNVEKNEIELRHYCFCLGKSEIIGLHEYNGTNYVQIEMHSNDNNEFKVIFKDYLTKYDVRDTKFLIDEYGSKTYIDLNNVSSTINSNSNNITEYNLTHTFYNTEDYEEIEKATDIAYLIIYIILIIITFIILIILIRRHIKKKEEKETRKFWKKKLAKEEKKEQKKAMKEAKKLSKKNRKKK